MCKICDKKRCSNFLSCANSLLLLAAIGCLILGMHIGSLKIFEQNYELDSQLQTYIVQSSIMIALIGLQTTFCSCCANQKKSMPFKCISFISLLLGGLLFLYFGY